VAGLVAPSHSLPGAQALARIANHIIGIQALPGCVKKMDVPRVGVAMFGGGKQIAVDLASTPASTGWEPWKISSCKPTRIGDRSTLRLIAPA
jgi:hypothetical protein